MDGRRPSRLFGACVSMTSSLLLAKRCIVSFVYQFLITRVKEADSIGQVYTITMNSHIPLLHCTRVPPWQASLVAS